MIFLVTIAVPSSEIRLNKPVCLIPQTKRDSERSKGGTYSTILEKRYNISFPLEEGPFAMDLVIFGINALNKVVFTQMFHSYCSQL